MFNINSLPFFSCTAFCPITQCFLLMSEPVKATKCHTVQFVAVVQLGICPKVNHSATSSAELNLEAVAFHVNLVFFISAGPFLPQHLGLTRYSWLLVAT
jgi:hypothetical protein